MHRLLVLLACAAVACADPASQAPVRDATQDTAAALSAALVAYAEKSGLELDRRLWLLERPSSPPVSDAVLSELTRVAPGLRRIPADLDLVRCPEGQVMMHPVTSCPIAEDGVGIELRLHLEGDAATVDLGFLYPSWSGSQEMHLVRGPDGTWVLEGFGITVVS